MTIHDDITTYHAAGMLPELFVERAAGHCRDEEGKAFRAALVELHNGGVIDVLESARAIATSPVSQQDFFLIQSVYVEIIPELNDTIPAMIAAVKALVARAGDDLVSGMPNGAFRDMDRKNWPSTCSNWIRQSSKSGRCRLYFSGADGTS